MHVHHNIGARSRNQCCRLETVIWKFFFREGVLLGYYSVYLILKDKFMFFMKT